MNAPGVPMIMIPQMDLLDTLSNNKFFLGVIMFVLNLGSRYIDVDMKDYHKEFISSKLIRRLAIFTIAFMATRDIFVSVIIGSLFILIVFHLCNFDSPLCILPKSWKKIDTNNDGQISMEEINQAYEEAKKQGWFKIGG
jgi:hypothetical protein